MIAVGTDILAVERVERVWRSHRERFAQRVLTAGERERCAVSAQPWRFLAKRFAAKEAIAKALGCGIGVRLSWQDIHIENTPAGAPEVTLSARALAVAAERGGSRILLIISDERDYAVAFAALVG
jgi:holo-[acyl-carrier protein] synthase